MARNHRSSVSRDEIRRETFLDVRSAEESGEDLAISWKERKFFPETDFTARENGKIREIEKILEKNIGAMIRARTMERVRMNATSERASVRANERTNERTSERTGERASERVDEQADEKDGEKERRARGESERAVVFRYRHFPGRAKVCVSVRA